MTQPSYMGCAVLLVAALASACAMVGPGASGDAAPTRAERRALAELDEAEVDAARGRLDEAEVHYRAALAVYADDARALAGLARVRLGQGDLEEAVALDDRVRASGMAPSAGLAPLERCRLWLEAASERVGAGRTDAAVLLDRLESEPTCASVSGAHVRAEVHVLEAERARAAGDSARALESARAAVVADPTRSDLAERLARGLLEAGRRRDAIEALDDALARHPDVRALQGLMLEALGVPGAEAWTGPENEASVGSSEAPVPTDAAAKPDAPE